MQAIMFTIRPPQSGKVQNIESTGSPVPFEAFEQILSENLHGTLEEETMHQIIKKPFSNDFSPVEEGPFKTVEESQYALVEEMDPELLEEFSEKLRLNLLELEGKELLTFLHQLEGTHGLPILESDSVKNLIQFIRADDSSEKSFEGKGKIPDLDMETDKELYVPGERLVEKKIIDENSLKEKQEIPFSALEADPDLYIHPNEVDDESGSEEYENLVDTVITELLTLLRQQSGLTLGQVPVEKVSLLKLENSELEMNSVEQKVSDVPVNDSKLGNSHSAAPRVDEKMENIDSLIPKI